MHEQFKVCRKTSMWWSMGRQLWTRPGVPIVTICLHCLQLSVRFLQGSLHPNESFCGDQSLPDWPTTPMLTKSKSMSWKRTSNSHFWPIWIELYWIVEVLSSLTTNNKFHGSKNPVATYEVCFFFWGWIPRASLQYHGLPTLRLIKNSEKTTILFQVHMPTTDKFVCTKCEQKLFHSTYL
jgi:hypothetical protein